MRAMGLMMRGGSREQHHHHHRRTKIDDHKLDLGLHLQRGSFLRTVPICDQPARADHLGAVGPTQNRKLYLAFIEDLLGHNLILLVNVRYPDTPDQREQRGSRGLPATASGI
jgi:hypothetical protein